MTNLAFVVHHRTVDLVSMSAARAVRESLGVGKRLLALRRDEAYVIESSSDTSPDAWREACLHNAAWFNPNKHRHALYDALPGALDAARSGASFPRPWLTRLLATDRPDLAGAEATGLGPWLALPGSVAGYGVTLATWDLEEGIGRLPRGSWPDAEANLLRLLLWTVALRAESPDDARQCFEGFAVTRGRGEGLLVHPHMEGWAWLGTPTPLAAPPEESASP